MIFWKRAAHLKQQLEELRRDLDLEQSKSARLFGFIRRLQAYALTPTGQAPRREFSEAFVDSLRELLRADLVVVFLADPETLELIPEAGRGIAPDVLAKARIRMGESVLGRAAQDLKMVFKNSVDGIAQTDADAFFTAPFMIVPLLSQGSCAGLLLIAKPQSGVFTPEDRDLAASLAMQGALTLEDYAQHAELERQHREIVAALARALDAKDGYTHKHSDRTKALVRALALELQLPEVLIREIEDGALLHDLGKIGIDDAILRKEDKLTPAEYDVMKTHPVIGHRILQALPSFRRIGTVVLYHQEWYNGAGYPEGLAGEEIPLGARIVQVLDAWDAMTSDRAYRKAMPKSSAAAELRRQAGTQFDPRLVEIFLRVIDKLEREGFPVTEINHAPQAVDSTLQRS